MRLSRLSIPLFALMLAPFRRWPSPMTLRGKLVNAILAMLLLALAFDCADGFVGTRRVLLASCNCGQSGGGGVLPSYTGQLATRNRPPNSFVTAGSESQMSRSLHYSRTYITSLAIDIPTWWISHATLQEAVTGGTWQARASVEYPLGTCTQFKFAGSTSAATLPDNTDNFTDQLPITIPNNALFGIRIYLTGGPGIMSYGPASVGSNVSYQGGEDYLNGERYKFGTSGVTDQTATCDAIADNTAGLSNQGATGFGPAAIVGPTTQPSFYFWGDSRVEAIEDFYNDNSTNTGELARSIGPSFGYINGGISQLISASWIGGSYARAHQIALSKYASHLASEVGVNDATPTDNSATIIANNQTAWGLFGATRVLITTIPPETTSTDSWATVGNQTATSNAATLDSYNTKVKAGISGTKGFIDFAAVARDTVSTDKWKASTITATFTATCAVKVLTVSAIASGALAPLDTINGASVLAGTSIVSQATGSTGSTGTYNLSNTCTVGSGETMVSNAATTDGIHETGAMNQLYNTSGVFNAMTIH